MIKTLTICEWNETECNNTEINNPALEDIISAIRSLNGKTKSEIYLTPEPNDPDTYLCIGGGRGKYIVTGSINNEKFPTVINSETKDNGKEQIFIGGQEGDYPKTWIVDIKIAIKASKSFYENNVFYGDDFIWIDA